MENNSAAQWLEESGDFDLAHEGAENDRVEASGSQHEVEGSTCEGDPILNNRELGLRGEEAAVRYLQRRSYDILDRNWACFAGEADIVARDGDGALVFVEVKTRTDTRKGFPAESVTARKRSRYEKIALAYLAEYDEVDIAVRFDVISIMVIASDRALIKHHIGAFCAME
ncbi:MAG: YraN family protein [Eggerthellaceae bacterium]|nr:YraN family protein [Eggerthellaceae bacterium]